MKIALCLLILSASVLGSECQTSSPEPLPLLYIDHYIINRNGATIGHQTIPGLAYSVESSTNLIDWVSKTNYIAKGFAASYFFSSDDINVNKQQYFRIKYGR